MWVRPRIFFKLLGERNSLSAGLDARIPTACDQYGKNLPESKANTEGSEINWVLMTVFEPLDQAMPEGSNLNFLTIRIYFKIIIFCSVDWVVLFCYNWKTPKLYALNPRNLNTIHEKGVSITKQVKCPSLSQHRGAKTHVKTLIFDPTLSTSSIFPGKTNTFSNSL